MTASPDIVSRITQNINVFQRSKVRITGPLEMVNPAARKTDIIKHRSFMAALAGAVVGALISAAVFGAASFLLGGFGGFVVGMAILMTDNPISNFINSASQAVENFFTSDEPDGLISKGSTDVKVNGLELAYATPSEAKDQSPTVDCKDHGPEEKIAQGSETVTVNNMPVARQGDKTTCDATIKSGSQNVFIGSGQATYAEIKDEFSWWQKALLVAVEFVVPPTAIFGKGLLKGLSKIGKIAATKGARAGAAVAARMAAKAAKGIAKAAARKAQNAARLAKAAGRSAINGAKAAAKGARAVGNGIKNGVKKAGQIAGERIACAKAALANGNYREALKKLVRGDPIDVLTGQVVEQRVDFTLGQTLPLSFMRTWSHHKADNLPDGLCGKYWVDNFSESLEITDNGRTIRIATFEGGELVFSWYASCKQSLNPLYPQYTLIRHRDYFELFNRDTRISKLFYFIETPEIDPDNEQDEETETDAILTYPPLSDGRYLISAWLDTFDNVVQFHYNEHAWLESVSHTDGMILTLEYQGEWLHSITRVDNGQQQVLVTYTQDENGYLLESDALLDYHLFYSYDSQANLTRWEDKDRTWVEYHYDEQGRVIHSHGADGFYPVWFDYAENQTRVRDSKGNVTVYDFDPHIMKPLAITSPNGAVTRFEYDPYGNLLSQIFTDGTQVSFAYLEQTGLVTAFTDPMGNQWKYAYNEDEQLVRIEDPIGRVWTAQEEKTTENSTALFTAPDGSQTAFVRNAFGLLTHVLSKTAQQSPAQARLQATYHYDPRHRLVETQDAEQRRIQLSYNGEDQISQLQTAGGRFWQYGYTRHQKLAHIHRPNQSTESQTYDRHGNLVKYTDANGVIWQLKYGAFDLLREKIDGEGNLWRYDYDKDSLKLNRVTNPKGEHYTYTFNADGQVETETDFAGNQWHYAYLPNGSLQTLTDGEGNQTHYRYNANGQLTQLNTVDDTISYTYDQAGRVIKIQSTDSTITYTYDINDRVIEETQNNHKIHRTFDDVNNIMTRHLYPNGQEAPISTSYRYNNLGELVELSLPNWDSEEENPQTTTTHQGQGKGKEGNTSSRHTLRFLYDDEGNEISRLSNLGFILNQQFNEMNLPIRQRAGHEPRTHFDTTELRLTGIDSPSFAELNRTYQYDKALNTIAANDEIEDLKFVVNGNNQITRVISQYQTREHYHYDQNGYISQQYIHTEDYRYNDGDARGHIAIDNHDLYQQGNKLNRIGNQHYRYDNAGRLIEKTDIQDGFRQKTTYYRWNGNNQLESLTNARGETWYYKYDALGRRTEKACPQQNTTTRYLWDDDQVAYQETERHGKTESKRHSVFNGWELIAQQDGYQKQDLRRNRKQWTQTTGYAVCQPNGQPLALFNPQGKRTWRKAPNSLWGLPLLSSWERKQAEPLNPNLLFAGQYTDDESGLAYNRFRYYDPQSGNYLASDPIGLNGGETPYSYVHNPMGWVDPFGLAGCSSYLKKWGKGRDGFKNFWDNSSYDEFMEAWNNKAFRDNIKTRLRKNGVTSGKGGYHEWLPVSQADKFKQMGVGFEDYMKWRTPTNKTGFLDDLGNYGSHTGYNGGVTSASAQAHQELINIAQAVSESGGNAADYLQAVRNWAGRRLPFGKFDLPF